MSWLQEIKDELPVILAGAALSGIFGYFIGRYQNRRRKLNFIIDDVFVLQEHGMESFENLSLVLSDKEGKKIEGNIVLAQFTFKNTGNDDIRIFKEHGEYLRFTLDNPLKIIDVGNSEFFDFNSETLEVSVKENVLKVGKSYDVGLVVQFEDGVEIDKKDVGALKNALSLSYNVDNLRKISGAEGSVGSIVAYIAGLFVALICFWAVYLAIFDLSTNSWIGEIIVIIVFGFIGVYFSTIIFKDARRELLFRKRQE